jgi:hypothetical protein
MVGGFGYRVDVVWGCLKRESFKCTWLVVSGSGEWRVEGGRSVEGKVLQKVEALLRMEIGT